MKKITSIAAVALFCALAMTSCKKDYTCVCTANAGGQTVSTEASLGKQTKKDAEAACSAKATSVGGVSYECKLK